MIFRKNKVSQRFSATPHFGAGYGSRTRLHGLGSRCITDIRTLRRVCIIANTLVKFKDFLSVVMMAVVDMVVGMTVGLTTMGSFCFNGYMVDTMGK